MKIIRTKDYADMSRKAANIISAQVIMKPDCVLGLATGGQGKQENRADSLPAVERPVYGPQSDP